MYYDPGLRIKNLAIDPCPFKKIFLTLNSGVIVQIRVTGSEVKNYSRNNNFQNIEILNLNKTILPVSA
jgi:hypothetical protein